MKENKTRIIAMNAMIAALYAVFTLMIQPLAYKEVQLRLSEIIVLLAFYNKKLIPGLVVGCLIANIPSPLGIIDMVVGTSATLIACIGMYKVKNMYLAAFIGGVVNGILVGLELSIVYNIPFMINALYVFIGEFIVLLIGTIIFKRIEKNDRFIEYIQE